MTRRAHPHPNPEQPRAPLRNPFSSQGAIKHAVADLATELFGGIQPIVHSGGVIAIAGDKGEAGEKHRIMQGIEGREVSDEAAWNGDKSYLVIVKNKVIEKAVLPFAELFGF